MKVILCDDDRPYLEFIKTILSDSKDYQVVATATNLKSSLEVCTTVDADLVLLDLNFGYSKSDGLEILKKIKLVKPNLIVLILTAEPDDDLFTESITAGASGFMTKEMLHSIEAKLTEALIMVPKLQQAVKEANKQIAYAKLSDQVIYMLECIAKGMTQKQISNELGITQKAVETAIGRARKELKNYGIDI